MFPSPDRPLRIGAVNYLNSKPLIEGLAELAPDAELILDVPSRLADELAAGKLDVALIPSVECLLNPDYEIVSDACVATRGPVLSVKLFSRVPPRQIKRLALDVGSRTSATLVQILLAERCGIRPDLEQLPLGLSTADTTADAILLIGDRAIFPLCESFDTVWDLGEEWTNWTGLPFVFAMWATRTGTELGRVEEALFEARDRGLANVETIARREASLLSLPFQTTLDYLTKNLHFRLEATERRGLRRFHQLAIEHEFAPGGNELVYRPCTPA
ncbi:MAG: menaquinone biosynthesis protein [Planctomycetales bacterium]|nr:menaquinone biosynthesis protein [Planctomycetales bacterium]